MIDKKPILELLEISKAYPGVIANNRVNLEIKPGQIHALLGENGAGKSTLVKIIYGVQRCDSGKIKWEGSEVSQITPQIARKLGIGMVFQHFSLFDAMTVEENIALGIPANLANENLYQNIIDISEKYGLRLDPCRYVQTLSVGERQRIEVVRCLIQNPKLLIMDEPTSVLTPQEVDKLFKTLRRLSTQGVAILYISHKLQEIIDLCHVATIMRAGEVVDTCIPSEESPRSMAEMMMGANLMTPKKNERMISEKPYFCVNNLNHQSTMENGIDLKDITIQAHKGEILGVAGIAGNGQNELMEILSGEVRASDTSSVSIDQVSVGGFGPRKRRENGMGFVPEERLGHGAVPEMLLWENAFLSGYQSMKLMFNGFMNVAKSREYTEKIISSFKVKTPNVNVTANSLSGGNLQKFIFGREILQDPKVLIVFQPTWGVDAGSAAYIRQSLINIADRGAAVIVISQDLEELYEISDKISVICEGNLTKPKIIENISVEHVGLLMAGIKPLENDDLGDQ